MIDFYNSRIASLLFDEEFTELIPAKAEKINNCFVLSKKGVEFRLMVEKFGDSAFYCALSAKNISCENSPRIQNVNSFDCVFDSLENPILTSLLGDNCLDHGQMQTKTNLPNGYIYSAEPTGGRSSNTTAFPYFNITDKEKSRVFAIGWSGQWKTNIIANKDNYRITVGISNCDFYLKPNESVIFPSMLVLEGNDLVSSRNEFRQLVIKHFSPKRSAEDLRPISLSVGSCFDDKENTESALIKQVDYAKEFDFDVIWSDAIWFKGGWDRGVGNYEYKDILPNGLKPISDLAHKQGKRFLQWFEIERAFPNTDMYLNHRDKLLRCYTRTEFDLVDFGNEETWNLVFDRVCSLIEAQGIDIFRQDANIDPLLYLEYNDEKDRIGIHQLHYIEGLYRFWDSLLKKYPSLVIDNCASGGRRLDFEAMRRSVSFCSSDYPNDGLEGEKIKYNINHMLNLSLYVPNVSSISCGKPNTYYFRSGYNGAICMMAHPFIYEDKEKAQKLISEAKRIREYFYGNCYHLTKENADITAYQYSVNDSGMVMILCHNCSNNNTVSLSLFDIDENKNYLLTITDEELNSRRVEVSGNELKSYSAQFEKSNTSMLIEYKAV